MSDSPELNDPSEEITEYEEPADIQSAEKVFLTPRPFDSKKHKALTQRALAFTTLFVSAGLYLGSGVALVLGLVNGDDFNRLTSAFSPFTALTAAALAFYFAQKK
jgi:hypothetical protein